MTKTLYLDCSYGIAGDMTLSALCGLGADLKVIRSELDKVVNFNFSMEIEKVNQYGITANHLKLTFENEIHSKNIHKYHHEGHMHNHYASIKQMINDSDLNEHVKEMSLRVFKTIAVAEGKIHGVPLEEVTFHEVGATDSIIDIIGNCIAIDLLGVTQIECTSVPTGHGKIHAAHGLYPIPAPATLEILKNVPLSGFSVEGEITTPTGAALIKTLTNHFVEDINGSVQSVAYGAGTKHFDHPNVLRAMIIDVDEKKKIKSIV